jgi:superfamily II RNA helicase
VASETSPQRRAAAADARERPTLASRLPPAPIDASDEILSRFLGWISDVGLTPYPEQEDALLELALGKHVVLATPTGSGKSLVAQGLHFRALCRGERSFYTAPVKALVSEKFFDFCRDFGPERVGMLTGDASINPQAKLICCTTEVLANMALRSGEALDAPAIVLDEFHYYADPERGVAWQIPLIALPHAQFLLMSATLGNTAPIEEKLAARSGREVASIHGENRPVPLEFDYRETPLHETLEELVASNRAPVYVVSFTQRECGELAQGLTSANLATREQRDAIGAALEGVRFDTLYGKDLRRFLRFGIGVHHAGLLPRYRLLVEKLAQQGLLRVICGTDTLGVGVNIPIRTVLFTRLSKFDGQKSGILSIREFKQIAGRAGRKGFDARGYVVCPAPEHVVEKRRLEARGQGGGAAAARKAAKAAHKKAPPRGFVPYNRETFERLAERPPEPLESRFDVDHGMLVAVLERVPRSDPSGAGYRQLIDLIGYSHEGEGSKRRLRRRAAQLFRSLRSAGVVEVEPLFAGGCGVRVAEGLQQNFALHETLSLYVVEAANALDRMRDDYALTLLSLVEAVLENPLPILLEQTNRAKGQLLAELKAQGVDYEDRIRRLEDVSYPKPEEEFLRATFALFAERHPWVAKANLQPKSVAREMVEGHRGFVDYVRDYQIGRSEGLLLRYLSQVHNTLVKTVPQEAKTEAVTDVIAYLHALVARVDASLMEAWEGLLAPEERPDRRLPELPPFDLARHERLLVARARAELHQLVAALARRDFEEAAALVESDPDDAWTPARFETALAPYFAEYAEIVFTPAARSAAHTLVKRRGPREWEAYQKLVDPAGDELWTIAVEIDLRARRDFDGPMLHLRRIGT